MPERKRTSLQRFLMQTALTFLIGVPGLFLVILIFGRMNPWAGGAMVGGGAVLAIALGNRIHARKQDGTDR